MTLRVEPQDSDGNWCVMNGAALVEGDLTNAQAWRLRDRLAGDPLNRQESVNEWAFRQKAVKP